MLENLQTVIVGKSGTGKSVYTRYLLKQYIQYQSHKKIILIDESLDHWRVVKKWGFKKVEIDDTTNLVRIDYKKLISENNKLFFEVTRLLEDEIVIFLDLLCLYIYEEKNILLIIDELHKFFWSTGYGCPPSIELRRLWTGGRKAGVDLIGTTQMIVDINIRTIKQANLLISFQLTEENEIKKIAPYFYDGEKILPSLKRGEFLIKNLMSGKQEQKNSYHIKSIKTCI